MFGLKEEIVRKINSVFDKYPHINQVILYGSRAKGNYRNGSDIDLTLIGENVDLTTLLKIENELDDLFLPYKFDVSIFEKLSNPDLKEHINRVGVVFYERK